MNNETFDKLCAINKAFYEGLADAFDRTRNHPWPGWQRMLERLPEGPLSVLDVACGNGRLLDFLRAHRPEGLSYLGLDQSRPLLQQARARFSDDPRARFVEQDILLGLPKARFSLVCAFGLTHHIPGFDRRAALIARLCARVAPGGLLAISFWRFARQARFQKRLLPWSAHPEVDRNELEPGDHLLCWGEGEGARYCHSFEAEELDRLLEGLDAVRYLADGRSQDLNEYALIRPRPGST